MRKTSRFVAVVILSIGLMSTLLIGGCRKESAPVLTQQQLQAGVIGKEHPVDQATAQQMGCSCHVEAAKAAGQ